MKLTIRMRVKVRLNCPNSILSTTLQNTLPSVIAKEIKKRRILVLCAFMRKLQKNEKRPYRKKQYWVAPYLKDRPEHSFYYVSIPKLTIENGVRFHNYFRMSATQFEELLSIVGPLLIKENVIREPIQPKERLMITLRYLASGDSMTSMSYQYLVGVTTVCNIIRETCEAIWSNLCPLVLLSVLSEGDWLEIANDFEELSNFIHCIGAIDGKHVTIQCPNNAGSTYYNYKHAHSVVLMAICDARYIFRFVDIGAYGRRSDGGIFGDSAIGKNFNANRMNVPKPSAVAGGRILPYCLVGDEAFPLKSYLLRPYPGKNGLTSEQDIFNYRLSRARRFIENTFGILASQWRLYRKPIIAFPENAKLMVQATVCLHNWIRKDDIDKNAYVSAGMVDEIHANDPNSFTSGSWRRIFEDGCAFRDIGHCGSNTSARNCIQMRDEFCDYFCSEGEVPWQNNRHK
ncbi:putative nuclease HARBI1 [Linepithema humile]|uniref:putative nuclease HARBI1 n=1 Tax=Linepithema humile TaxID=83485 RepID=UPI00351F42F7